MSGLSRSIVRRPAELSQELATWRSRWFQPGTWDVRIKTLPNFQLARSLNKIKLLEDFHQIA